MNSINPDCIIIGGGLIGLMTARELNHSGLKVAVFDSGTTGTECSWAGGGILSPLYPWREPVASNALAALSQGLYPDLAVDLAAGTGIDPEWVQSGIRVLAVEDWQQAISWAQEQGIVCEVVNASNALWFPATAQIRSPRLLSALKASLIGHGVVIYEQTRVQQIRSRRGRVEGIDTEKGHFNAELVIIASGAWTSSLVPDIPVRPVRGQMLCYQAPKDYLSHIILKDGIYLIPRKDGHILAGSTVEEAGFDKNITQDARADLSNAAEVMLPGINRFPIVGHWAGLRPAPHSSLPYICAYPGIEGLYLNTGHHRNGILFAPGSARLLADQILARPLSLPASAFESPAMDRTSAIYS